MSKWKCEICNSSFENFDARGFDNKIYCPLCYYKKLYKDTELEIERLNNKVEELMELYTTERHCKDDYKAIIKEIENYVNKTHIPIGYKEYILQVIKENKDDNY